MSRGFARRAALALALAVLAVPAARSADTFALDKAHAAVSFQVEHVGISYIHGRFNDFTGELVFDKADPSQSSLTLTIKADSIDTNQRDRDKHLKGTDFFNVEQFPTITFKSTSFKPLDKEGFEVTGDLTLHGVTKPITFKLNGGKEVEFPPKTPRIGFWTDLKIKRSDFGMTKFIPAAGDTVYISVSAEGVKK